MALQKCVNLGKSEAVFDRRHRLTHNKMLRQTFRTIFRPNPVSSLLSSRLIRPVLSSRRLHVSHHPSAQKPISDYIASQPPPSNPETPADRMPHQTEEDIATENIFGTSEKGNKDGLPDEGVPIEEIFEENPTAMKRAPKAIKEERQ